MWTEFKGNSPDWDSLMNSLANVHPTLHYAWPESLDSASCMRRFAFVPAGASAPTAAIQFSQKSVLWGIPYLRSDGGVAGDVTALESLREQLTPFIGKSNWYIRIFSRAPRSAAGVVSMQMSGFHPVLARIQSGLSAKLELAVPYAPKYSSNWRHNLTRANKRGLKIAHGNTFDPKQVYELCKELERTKQIGPQFSLDSLAQIPKLFGQNLLTSTVSSPEGELLSLRAALRLGDFAFDLIAATSEKGRTQYASNLGFHSVLECCARDGVKFYDCAGIDPLHGRGVMQFKMGTGAQAFEYLGEWDYSPQTCTRYVINFLMGLKLIASRETRRILALAPKRFTFLSQSTVFAGFFGRLGFSRLGGSKKVLRPTSINNRVKALVRVSRVGHDSAKKATH